MSRIIDLNADLGEYDDAQALGRDRAIMAHISSASIACGGHAGNDRTMIEMLEASAAARVAAGAHPSYPDRENFGRASMVISDENLAASLIEQILALKHHADAQGIELTHVKPHGQLYNDAADSVLLARMIATVIARTLPGAAFVGLAGSEMATAARNADLAFVAEGFADRRYTSQGRLVPRKEAGAMLESVVERIEQALAMACKKAVLSIDGAPVKMQIDSICLHSDSEGALASARDIRTALDDAGIEAAWRR